MKINGMIISFVEDNPGTSTTVIAMTFQMTLANTLKDLNQLEKAGKVRSEGTVTKKWFFVSW